MTLIEVATTPADHCPVGIGPDASGCTERRSRWSRAARSGTLWAYLGLIALLTLLSIGMWWRVWISGDPSKTMICGCGDPGLNLWFLRWAEWSLIHLHNPFLSNAIYAGQGGANTLDTDTIFTGIVGIPLTALFGPVLSFNLLSTLVPVVNGWSMFFFLRRVTRFYPGQVLASALYGFSPYVVQNAMYGHFNVDLVVYPPLVLWCLHDLLLGRRHEPLRVGLLLGVLTGLQFIAGPEQLAMCAVVGVFAMAVLAVLARDLVRERLRALVTAGLVAGGLSVVLLAYPVWFLVLGPRHTTGYPWPNLPSGGNSPSDLLNPGLYSTPALGTQIDGYYGPRGPAPLLPRLLGARLTGADSGVLVAEEARSLRARDGNRGLRPHDRDGPWRVLPFVDPVAARRPRPGAE